MSNQLKELGKKNCSVRERLHKFVLQGHKDEACIVINCELRKGREIIKNINKITPVMTELIFPLIESLQSQNFHTVDTDVKVKYWKSLNRRKQKIQAMVTRKNGRDTIEMSSGKKHFTVQICSHNPLTDDNKTSFR